MIRRVSQYEVRTFGEIHQPFEPGSLLAGTAPERFQLAWNNTTTDRFRPAAGRVVKRPSDAAGATAATTTGTVMAKNKNVAQVLLDILADAGARDIFGVTGDALNTLLEGIRTDDRFRWYGMRHEENAAYAAYAQAEITGGIGVCAGTVGPGSLHLINGLYNAKREGAGVVAITGQVAHIEKGTGYFQEVDLEKAFDDICDYQAIVNTPEQVTRVCEIAVQKALVEKCVVRIELPVDIIGAEVPGRHFLHPLTHSRPHFTPPAEDRRSGSRPHQRQQEGHPVLRRRLPRCPR